MLLKAYWEILRGMRVRALVAVLLLGTTGLMEGLALLALIPVLQSGLSGEGVTNGANYIGGLLEWLSVPKGYTMGAGISVFVVLATVTAFIRLGADTMVLRLRTRIEERCRRRMGRALLRMSWSRYITLRLGDISKAMIIEGQQIGNGVQFFLDAIGNVLVSFGYLAIAVIISLKMSVFTGLFVIVGGVGYRLLANRARHYADQLSRMATIIGERVDDIFGNMKFFRITGAGFIANKRAGEVYKRYAKTYFLSQVFVHLMRFGYELGATVFVGLFLAIALFVYNVPIAVILVFLAIFYRLVPRLLVVQQSLFQARTYLPWYLTWKERFNTAAAYEEYRSGGQIPSEFTSLEFHAVAFRYQESSHPILERVDLTVSKGDCVAIVGPSGSGKTTIIDLITGLLRPSAGAIRVNQIDLSSLDLDAWRGRIGLVMQDAPLFHASILENIAWGDSEPDRVRAKQAARMAHAWEFVGKYPEGLDRIVGEKGSRLSGGQRQRLALARALYQDPWLLVLDEATSALDSHSEAMVQSALRGLKGKCTILLVAHRLKTVQIANRIAVLEHGCVAEYGAWNDLIQKDDGVFHRFAVLQGLA